MTNASQKEIIMSPEMVSLKARLKATWESGNYAHFALLMKQGALEFLKGLELEPGTTMLDIGCGAGQIAIPAARSGVRVTGIDIADTQIKEARRRAAAEALDVRFEEGDAEALPYADSSFDVVVSLIGAMFAPRPERVAAEMLRVCKAGGRISMANWTADGFVGQLLKTVGKHVPPSPLMPSPLLWGSEDVVRERFRSALATLHFSKRQYPFAYPFSPSETVDFYRHTYGPINRAFAALEPDQQCDLYQTDSRMSQFGSSEGTLSRAFWLTQSAIQNALWYYMRTWKRCGVSTTEPPTARPAMWATI